MLGDRDEDRASVIPGQLLQTALSDLQRRNSVGGIKMPYSTEMHAGPVVIVTTVNEVAFDEPMAKKMFEPPAPSKP